jgi:putative hydrolase of the HAD superfamily
MEKTYLLERIKSLTHPLSPISINHKIKLQKLDGIRCVAFDFYGTMFISAVGDIGVDEKQESASTTYFEEALENTGFTILEEKAGERGIDLFERTVTRYKETAKNNGIDYPEPDIVEVWKDVLTKLKNEQLIDGDLSGDAAVCFGIEFEFRINDIWPTPDLGNLLNSLLDRKLTLGIISNSQFYTPIAFEAFMGKDPAGFGFDPDLLIWSYDAGRKKPSTHFYELFVQAAQKKELYPHEVLYVGNDIRKDIQPAKKLGMKTALYVGDERSIRHDQKELEKTGFAPDLVIDDLHQILECL